MTLISRDPFARTELHSTREYELRGTCKWCGRVNQTPGTGRSFLYRYTVESDGGRKADIPGTYCSVSCMRSYTED